MNNARLWKKLNEFEPVSPQRQSLKLNISRGYVAVYIGSTGSWFGSREVYNSLPVGGVAEKLLHKYKIL